MTGVTGTRLMVGFVVMGVAVPLTLFYLLSLETVSQFLTIAACTFLSWGVADLFARILEKPRLKGRSARGAIDEEFERRFKD